MGDAGVGRIILDWPSCWTWAEATAAPHNKQACPDEPGEKPGYKGTDNTANEIAIIIIFIDIT